MEEEGFLSDPFLAMKFESALQRIVWQGNTVLAIGEDCHAQIMDAGTKTVVHLKPGHEGSARNGAVDPLGEFAATVGCDGVLHIYKLP
mmetsp:Transcript_25411/g.19151  ORF Transcript_25411/g.19151 Transcript_25411/m.19151 type:complete len:88 (-) Transcript_25411:826-1089(-)